MTGDILDQLLLIESEIDIKGWDQPDRLYALHKKDDGEVWLQLILDSIESEAQLLNTPKLDAFGLVISSEAYEYHAPDGAMERARELIELLVPTAANPQKEAALRTTVEFLTMLVGEVHGGGRNVPDNKEVRLVMCVTKDGKMHYVRRVRGESCAIQATPDHMSGQFLRTLVSMLDPTTSEEETS